MSAGRHNGKATGFQRVNDHAILPRLAISEQLGGDLSVVLGARRRNHADAESRRFLSHHLGVVIEVEVAEADECPAQPGLTTNLARPTG